MKHPTAVRHGYAKRNRGTGILNWKVVYDMFPTHREHIYRIRKDLNKLYGLRNRLAIKFGVKL